MAENGGKGSSLELCGKTGLFDVSACPPRTFAPVEPRPVMGRTILAHEYAVCEECFVKQYVAKYGHEPA
jgi:hypothetical protein